MNKLFALSGITFFKTNKGKLYFQDNDGVWVRELLSILLFDREKASNIVFYDVYYIILNDLNQPLYYSNTIFEPLKQISNIRISKILSNYIVYYTKKPQYTCGLFDLVENTFFKFDKNYFEYCFNSNFYSTFANGITCLTNKTQPLWHYNLPEKVYNFKNNLGEEIAAEILRIIGVYEGVLWVVLNSGHLIGLSETTGELVAELSDIQFINFKPTQSELISHYINEKQNINEFGKYLQLDAEKGVLFGLYSKFYYEIDLNATPKNLQIYDISDTCDEFQITPKMPGYEKAWEGDEIFFGQIDTQANTVGIFNRKQKEITWAARVGQVVDWRPIVQKIDYAAGRLYVLDGENTLHVFENKQS